MWSVQGINKTLAFPKPIFQDVNGRKGHRYYMPMAKITNFNVLADHRSFFDKPVKNNSKK